VLITVANTNSNTSPANPNLTNSTYPPPHTFSPALVSHILPIANAKPAIYQMPLTSCWTGILLYAQPLPNAYKKCSGRTMWQLKPDGL